MPVKRAEHLGHYTIVDNGFLNDKGLSLKAKGLLTLMLSLPDTWKYSVRGLAKKCKEGVSAITTTLQELEVAGYITRYQVRSSEGKFAQYEYIINEIAESPQASIPDAETPYTGNPDTAIPDTVDTQTDLPSAAFPAQVITQPTSKQQQKTKAANTQKATTRPINADGGLSDGSAERAEIKDQIDYELLCEEYPTAQIDELVELMVEVRLCTGDTYPLSRDRTISTAYLRDRLQTLTRDHIEFALDNICENTSEVKNVKRYLLNVLYNTAVTMDNAYAIRVNRDDAAAGRR